MKDLIITVVLALFVLGIIIALYQKVKRRNNSLASKSSGSDVNFYNLSNDRAYRDGVYRQVNIDFKPYIKELYRSIDELLKKAKQYDNAVDQAQYNSMISILKSADFIEQQIRSYWNSSKFNKDFLHYISLHYASHLLAGAIKTEQQKIKEIFVSCKRKQEQWGQKINTAQRHQEHMHGEQRRKMSAEIGEMCKIHKNISALKGQIGAINTKYNNRVTQQNIETAKRRDFIGTHFGKRGKLWRDRIMAKHQ